MTSPLPLPARSPGQGPFSREVTKPRAWDGIGAALRQVYSGPDRETARSFDALLARLD